MIALYVRTVGMEVGKRYRSLEVVGEFSYDGAQYWHHTVLGETVHIHPDLRSIWIPKDPA